MPKLFIAIISEIMDFVFPARVTLRKEEATRAKARATRKEQHEQEREYLYKVLERQLEKPKKKESLSEENIQKLITREQGWAEKGVQHFYTLKKPSFPEKIHGLERFYEVEIILPKAYASAYAYVECREVKGATVFLCFPSIKENKVYKALNFYNDQTLEMKESETLAMVEHVFAPLLESKLA